MQKHARTYEEGIRCDEHGMMMHCRSVAHKASRVISIFPSAGTREAMDFASRIKKEMTEGIVRAILEDAGYRVIDSGIEKIIRELSCLSPLEYHHLSYPEAISSLPDFTVMDRDQKNKFLVEVKYRSAWGLPLLKEVEDQVRIFKQITLISINANPPDEKIQTPSRYIRCCNLRHIGGEYQVELGIKDRATSVVSTAWKEVHSLNDASYLWWSMRPLQEVFSQLKDNPNRTLISAIKSIEGILN